MPTSLTKRRLFLAAGALAFVTLTVGLLARRTLTGMAASSLLHMAGASEVKFHVTQASPWRVVFEQVAFQVRTQPFEARRISFARPHWWTPSLGSVRVEQAWLPLTVDGSDTNPLAWPTYKNGTASVSALKIPADEISIDGRLVVRAAALPDQALTVKLEARLNADRTWAASASVDGPGLGAQATGRFDPATKALDFTLPALSVDLKIWQDLAQRFVIIPGGAVELAGRLTGSAQGRWAGKTFAATAQVHVADGRVVSPAHNVTADGVAVDLEFTDLDKFVTKPGTLRVAALQVGQFKLSEIDAEFAFGDANKIIVSRAALKALGGSLAVEPFKYFLSLRELDLVVLADNISVEEVMALTKDLPAKASGRVDGRLPVHIDDGGLRLGTGWLALKPGVYAQIQFAAAGLLTAGVSAKNPSYTVLKKIESGLLQLKVGELRLDIRPPNVPAGRTAQLHVVGEPVDPEVKAPVTLDLNVNGPLEKLLNLGMSSKVSIGSGK
jgi:hypothetical protein